MPIAAYDPQGNTLGQKRLLSAIYQDIQKLTAAQRTNLWTDLTTPVPGIAPRKYLADEGFLVGSIFSMDYTANQTTGAQQTSAQNSIMSCYIWDNPTNSVSPPFDPTINIPGYSALP